MLRWLVAYNASRRTREIGIRMALGAGSSDVLRLVMGKGLVLVGMGTAIGLAMSFGVDAESILLSISPRLPAMAGRLRARAKSCPDCATRRCGTSSAISATDDQWRKSRHCVAKSNN